VVLYLKLRRQARDRAAENLSLAESIGGVCGITAIRSSGTLPSDSLTVKGDRMNIHRATVRGTKYRSRRKVALAEIQPERTKRGDDIVNAPEFNDDVNVLVCARLLAE